MAFMKGVSGNPTGRPKGSKNKAAGDLREMVINFLEEKFPTVVENYELLEPKDKLKFYNDLLQYGLPKLQSVSTVTDFENMSEEKLDEIIKRLSNCHD